MERTLPTRVRDDFSEYDLNLIGGKDIVSMIRDDCSKLAVDFVLRCPEGRELSVALTKIEEAMFWAIASIERRHNGT